MAALGDVLLVLLGDQPGTAHDLQQRHNATFGPQERVDISRVSWMLTRQERLGYVRAANASRPAKQRQFELTEAGARRQRMWMLRVPADCTPDDIRTRVLLAVTAADRSTFETVVAVCLALLELNTLRVDEPQPTAVLSAASARAELAAAALAAQLSWLQTLRSRPRDRDRRAG
jgi:DNA-binding PadR family transcriptional regulator